MRDNCTSSALSKAYLLGLSTFVARVFGAHAVADESQADIAKKLNNPAAAIRSKQKV